MSGFSTAWLDLREAADHRARDPVLLAKAARLASAGADPLVVDIGAGTGSTLRALRPHFGRSVRWRLLDHDAGLLAEAARRADVETRTVDLAAPGSLPLAGATLVTASALVDLVSNAFLDRLVDATAREEAAVYAALNYDGTTRWDPVHPLDDDVLAAFNRDQRRDKGFGPALGPDGASRLADRLARAGYRVTTAPSPWRLGPADRALVDALAAGIAAAVAPELGNEYAAAWLAFRRDAAAKGRAEIGHIDVLGIPSGR